MFVSHTCVVLILCRLTENILANATKLVHDWKWPNLLRDLYHSLADAWSYLVSNLLMIGRRRQYTEELPELESLPDTLRRRTLRLQRTAELRHDTNDLEPAFVNESEYPPGWLVYHPALGVVLKETADSYKGSAVESTESVETSAETVETSIHIQTTTTLPSNDASRTESVTEPPLHNETENDGGKEAAETTKIRNGSLCLIDSHHHVATTTSAAGPLPVIHSVAAADG